MKTFDLRSCIDVLEKHDRLIRVEKSVKKDSELARIAWKIVGHRYVRDQESLAVLFENIDGYEIPIITGVLQPFNQPLYFGLENVASLEKKFAVDVEKLIKPKMVSSGPCQDVIITENIDLLKTLPIPHHNPMDAGQYITIGVQVSKDPETGESSQSIHRMQIKGPDKTGFQYAPGIRRHKELMYKKAEKMNKSLEVAVAIGVDPAVPIAAALPSTSFFEAIPLVDYLDKYEVAGALRGAPIELVKCKTVDLEVPANSEVVIEGEVLPNIVEFEGPFIEGASYLSEVAKHPIFKVKAITHRQKPIYHTLLSATPEHGLGRIIGSATRKSALPFVQRFAPQVTAFNRHTTWAIVAIDKTMEGQQKNAMLTVLGNNPVIKFVVVVDHNVDVYDYQAVLRAIGTRIDGEKNIFTIPDAFARQSDAAARVGKYSDGIVTKVGIDATMSLQKKIEQPMVEYEDIDLSKFLKKEDLEKWQHVRPR